jgi:soluble lytic murein transglycosylase-like protein
VTVRVRDRARLACAIAAAALAAAPVRAGPAPEAKPAVVKPLPRPHRPLPPQGWTSGRVLSGPAALPVRPAAPVPPSPAPAHAAPALEEIGPCEREIARAARRHGVPQQVLHAIGLTETGRRGRLSPFALNIDGATVFAPDAAGALARFEQARAAGAKFIDLGCMQINHRFHGAAFPSVAAMLDPARNVDYAARFLKQLRASQPSWTLAVARYNAGPNNERAQKRYVCAVIGQLVRAGHGAWTDSARAFCAGPS